jgi:hypothetical protein
VKPSVRALGWCGRVVGDRQGGWTASGDMLPVWLHSWWYIMGGCALMERGSTDGAYFMVFHREDPHRESVEALVG